MAPKSLITPSVFWQQYFSKQLLACRRWRPAGYEASLSGMRVPRLARAPHETIKSLLSRSALLQYDFHSDAHFSVGVYGSIPDAIVAILNAPLMATMSVPNRAQLDAVSRLILGDIDPTFDYSALRKRLVSVLEHSTVSLESVLQELARTRPHQEHLERHKRSGKISDLNAEREILVKALGLHITSPVISDALVDVVRNRKFEDPQVVAIAIWAIGQQNVKRSVPTLIDFLSEKDVSFHWVSIEYALQFICSGSTLIHLSSAAGATGLDYWRAMMDRLPDVSDTIEWKNDDARSVFWEKRLRCATGGDSDNWISTPFELLSLDEVPAVSSVATEIWNRRAEKDGTGEMAAFQQMVVTQRWSDVLLFLRRYPHSTDIPVHRAWYFRGRAYQELGDPESAVLFYDEAARLAPDEDSYPFLALDAISKVKGLLGEGLARCEAIIANSTSGAKLLCKAADLLFLSTEALSDHDAIPVFRQVVEVIRRAHARIKESQEELLPSVLAGSYVEMGMCLAHLGEDASALDAYDRAIEILPDSDAALTARGIFTYGTESSKAILDLRKAIDRDSSLVWPYLFVAHSRLLARDFQECLDLCQMAEKRSTRAGVLGSLREWRAISLFELGAPADEVRAAFKLAIETLPKSKRIRANFALFEQAAASPAIPHPHMSISSDFVNLRTIRELEAAALAA